jgi:branched-chain amino acid transport system substrate-binding protein
MKYKKIIILGALVLALLLYGLFADFNNDKHVKIGVTLPLSGNLSMYGESILNGINLAINEQNNSSDSLKIDLIVGNNEGSPNKAVSDVNNFVYVDKVSAVYNSFESLGLAAREIVEKTHVLMIMSTTYVLTAKDSPKFTFRDYWNFKNIGNDFNIILKKDSVSSVKILAQNDNSYNDFKSGIVQDGVELGREEKFNYGEKDFRTSLSKLNISSNDNLIVYAFPVEASLIVKQLIELGIQPNRLLITEATEYPLMSDSKSVLI